MIARNPAKFSAQTERMKRWSCLVAATLVAFAIGGGPSQAAQPPRVEGYVCHKLAQSTPANTMWNAAFRGQREGPFDLIEWTHEVRCFKSLSNCKAWVYWIQSDWPLMNQVRRCRRGLP